MPLLNGMRKVKYTNKNARKNRPKKKEMTEETWTQQMENLKRQYEHGGKYNSQKEQPPSGDTEEK